ncbi:GerAB/ArcD/ProY family transporter [Metabacillus malikii]|uniref:Spore germination protein KB n=1 Tax=Metabacillus malikii TaxID=1504265 RepID=A0ABT9ZCG3_9BACI|nr:endospore germination permease [Metabacillus malikii]MDQ0229949.1 spore germination protein KB [Metabacillus malikii]
MPKERLSSVQLIFVIVSFLIGNTFMYNTGSGAKQDAWLVFLFTMIGGFILMYVYIKLCTYYPGESLVQIIPKVVGRLISYPIILLYIIYFIYLASKACRDFGELIAATILDETPIEVVIASFMVLIIYCLHGGVEVFGRMGEVVFPIYIIAIMIVWILLSTVDQFSIENLTPVLGNGMKPVLNEIFPTVLTFPFGESIIITMFIPLLQKGANLKIIGFSAIALTTFLLVTNIIMVLSVLGPEVYSDQFFPLLSATRMISIADFLERFDALIILMMVAGVFFKVGGWIYGAATGISQLLKLKQNKSVLLGLGTIIAPMALIIASNQIEYNEIGLELVPLYIHIPLQIVIPLLLLVIAFIRNKMEKKKS